MTPAEISEKTRVPLAVVYREASCGRLGPVRRSADGITISRRSLRGWDPEFTTPEASDYLGLHEANVRRYCKSGRLAARQLGYRWITSRSACDVLTASLTPGRGRPRMERPSAAAVS